MNSKVSPSKLTHKQENFAEAIVDGHTQSEAYKLAYDTSNMLPATIHNSAYKLMHHGEIAARIAEAREAVATGLMAQRVLTAENLIKEYEINLQGAREDHAWAPANKAIKGMARLSGNLVPAEREEIPRITTVIYNLSGVDRDETGIVDAESYTVLPYGGESADTEA